MKKIEIYGESDDLVEIEGDGIRGEVGAYDELIVLRIFSESAKSGFEFRMRFCSFGGWMHGFGNIEGYAMADWVCSVRHNPEYADEVNFVKFGFVCPDDVRVMVFDSDEERWGDVE